MPVELVKLELIDDNPFQPITGYPTSTTDTTEALDWMGVAVHVQQEKVHDARTA